MVINLGSFWHGVLGGRLVHANYASTHRYYIKRFLFLPAGVSKHAVGSLYLGGAYVFDPSQADLGRHAHPFRCVGEKATKKKGMVIALYIAAAIMMAVGSIYFARRNRDFRKFLAGAFFVPSDLLFYLYLADVSVPLLGTGFVETTTISGARSIVHFILFSLCIYFGFVRMTNP